MVPFGKPPKALQLATVVLGCIVPAALVLMYWSKKVACDKVVTWTLWSLFAMCLLVMGWSFVEGGKWRSNPDYVMQIQQVQ